MTLVESSKTVDPKSQVTVYTAVFGGYEAVAEQNLDLHSNAQFVCLTDNGRLRAETWDLLYTPQRFPNDPRRSNRYEKLTWCLGLKPNSLSLYVDASVVLTADVNKLVTEWLADGDVAMFEHPQHRTVREEFAECYRHRLEAPHVLDAQQAIYERWRPRLLDEEIYAGTIIARRTSSSVIAFSSVWASQITLFSKRDQLSLNMSAYLSNVTIRRLPLDVSGSEVHARNRKLSRSVRWKQKLFGRRGARIQQSNS